MVPSLLRRICIRQPPCAAALRLPAPVFSSVAVASLKLIKRNNRRAGEGNKQPGFARKKKEKCIWRRSVCKAKEKEKKNNAHFWYLAWSWKNSLYQSVERDPTIHVCRWFKEQLDRVSDDLSSVLERTCRVCYFFFSLSCEVIKVASALGGRKSIFFLIYIYFFF